MAQESKGSPQGAMAPPPMVPRPAQAPASSAASAAMDVDVDETLGKTSLASTSRAEFQRSSNDDASVDLVSRLEGDLALLLQIMSSSLHYIANRSAHVQLSEAIPLFQPQSGQAMTASRGLVDRATMAESIEELTDDLMAKAKDMEQTIARLPGRQQGSSETAAKPTSTAAANVVKDEPSDSVEEASLASRRPRRGSRQQTIEADLDQMTKEKAVEQTKEETREKHEEEDEIEKQLRDIDQELHVANTGYREALEEARELKADLDALLRQFCDKHQASRAWLADAASKTAFTQAGAVPEKGSRHAWSGESEV